MDVNSNERRRQTRSNVYHYLYGAQEFCTRQSLAQALDLSLPTIYQNLTDLVDAGLVRYAGQSQSTGGRKASGLAIVPDARVAVGIALTEDRLRFSAADLRLNEIAYHKVSHTSNFEMEELGTLVARELEQFLDAPSIHPWPVYRALCRLVGELSVFSATLSALGETPQGTRALPPYDHENLQRCFQAACGIIARLVDTFVIGPAFTFALEKQGRPELLGTVMPQSARAGVYTYWLLVRTSQAEGMAERMERLAKLAPSESLDGIVAQALPGVRLRHSPQPPAGLPLRTDTLYFTIDQNDPLWRKIMQHGNLALMLPGPPEDLSVVLAVIQR